MAHVAIKVIFLIVSLWVEKHFFVFRVSRIVTAYIHYTGWLTFSAEIDSERTCLLVTWEV